jgi:o-succinylbenzoate synthase
MPSLEIIRVRVPFRAPFASATRTWTARDSWLVRLTGDDGATGWGEIVTDDPDGDPAVEHALARLRQGTALPAEASLEEAGEEEGATGRALLAGLAGAAMSQGAGAQPGSRGVGVNAVVPALDRDAAAGEAARRVEAGFRTVKLKVGTGEPAREVVARVAAVRAAVGDEIALRLDANGTWDLDSATAILRAVDDHGLQYVEQPLPPSDLEGMIGLRRRVGVPLAADEAVASAAAAPVLLVHDAVDVLVVKPARVGGLTAVARIESLATPRGVPVVVSSLFETGIGLAAALACASWIDDHSDLPGWPATERDHGLATAGLLEHDLLAEPLVVEKGRMRVPGGAGATALGVAVDLDAVERYRVPAA